MSVSANVRNRNINIAIGIMLCQSSSIPQSTILAQNYGHSYCARNIIGFYYDLSNTAFYQTFQGKSVEKKPVRQLCIDLLRR